jgi:hypothetical protein
VIPLGNGASTLSAYGIASGDVVLYHELERSLLASFDGVALATAVTEVRDAALAELAATGATGEPVVEIDALMRYREQLMHGLEIPVSPTADGATLLAGFEKEYARRYGEGGTALYEAVEVFALRARCRSRPGDRGRCRGFRQSATWPGWSATARHQASRPASTARRRSARGPSAGTGRAAPTAPGIRRPTPR